MNAKIQLLMDTIKRYEFDIKAFLNDHPQKTPANQNKLAELRRNKETAEHRFKYYGSKSTIQKVTGICYRVDVGNADFTLFYTDITQDEALSMAEVNLHSQGYGVSDIGVESINPGKAIIVF